MNVVEEYIKYGGFGGHILNILEQFQPQFLPLLKNIATSASSAEQDKLLENLFILLNENPQLKFVFNFCFLRVLILEISNKCDSNTEADLIEQYGAELMLLGLYHAEENSREKNKKNKAQLNGRKGGKTKHLEREIVKCEAIRIYEENINLHDFTATHVATRIHTQLKNFMKLNNMKKKDYTNRVIASWISSHRKSKKNNTI